MKKSMRMKRDRQGAIGIGTLIVFIAMVLVAVIAAAVIIKTASELEQAAEKYGDEARKEAGLSIKIQQFEGQANAGGDEIVNLQMYVTLFGGSESLDLKYLILHIVGVDNEGGGQGFSVDYIHPDADNPPGGANTYDVTEITDPLGSYDETHGGGPYILDQQSTLRIDLTGIDGTISDGLSPLSDITVKFMLSNGGATTTESANTPGSYLNDAWYNLV